MPGVDAAREAKKLLEDLAQLWGEANLNGKRRLLLTMLDAVYVDTKETRSIVSIKPRARFRPIFALATTPTGSGVVLTPGPVDPATDLVDGVIGAGFRPPIATEL